MRQSVGWSVAAPLLLLSLAAWTSEHDTHTPAAKPTADTVREFDKKDDVQLPPTEWVPTTIAVLPAAGAGDDDEDELAQDPVWEPETGREPGAVRGPGTAHGPEPARAPRSARMPGTAWTPEASRTPSPTTLPTPRSHRAPSPADNAFAGRPASPAARPYALASSSASRISERIRARLRTPDALREAFVVKEILDRPLGRRRRR